MQLLTLLTTLFLTATTASAACQGASTWVSFVRPSGNITTAERQLSASGGTVYIGNIKYSGRVEPLILNYPGGKPGGGEGGLTFTNYFSSATGWRNGYVFPNRSEPIGFTAPHSAYVPYGADTGKFSVGRDDRLLRYNGLDRWYLCPTTDYNNTYKLHFVGVYVNVPEGCVRTDIPVVGYGYSDWKAEDLY
ncbi:uncharacterized protein LAJ45_00019 [Morchella importuna]|nr:uncharacterized protein LAJ45_00019 [Morchella importuna]KAH8155011.1 hypothetical protein LAJ45_00019 [Morchella importuna]